MVCKEVSVFFYYVHFLIADTYNEYNKIRIRTHLNRMG